LPLVTQKCEKFLTLALVKSLNIYENSTYIRFLCTEMERYNIINNQQRQQFQAPVEGEIGFLEYRLHEGAIVLMHTEVPERLGGRGIATALAAAAFDYAQKQQLKVKVYCPFVRTYLNRHPELAHLVINPS